MSSSFDFKENAKALLKRIGQSTANPALTLLAVETALREAYAAGQGGTQVRKPATSPLPSRKSRASSDFVSEFAEECAHVWKEVFLDGRSVGTKCENCDILESEARKQCDHYFVRTDSGEICVACRAPRTPRR